MKLADGKLQGRARRKADGYQGQEDKDHGERRAESLLKAGLKHYALTRPELQRTLKSDPRKALVAELIQAETTVRLDWIASSCKWARDRAAVA